MSAVAPILNFARTRNTSPALVEGARTVTYGELAGLVRRTARYLASEGWKPADRIGLCLKDSIDHIVAFLAVALVGAVAVPLDWRARPHENARFLEQLGLACVLAEPEHRLIAHCPVLVQDATWRSNVSSCAEAEAQASPAAPSNQDWAAPLVISASSGSTGAPKFTQMTHLQFHFAITGMLELLDLAGRHRFLCAMPLYYSGGRNSCLAHLLRGDCVVLYPSLFTAGEYLEVVREQEITVAGVVPSVIRQLLALPGDGPLLPGLSTLFSTGAPLHANEKRQAAVKLTPNFHERYGTAETMAISVLRPADFIDRAGSVGLPHSFAEIEVVDETGHPLPAGSIGRLRYRGPGLATPLAGETMPSFRDGWYYTGELGSLDADGYILLSGRTSDVIIRNGAKIYPAEVEATLLDHPDILEAAVLGHIDPGTGDTEESVIAFLVARNSVGEGAILAHCRSRLSAHKVPRKFHFAETLPRNTAGKIDKLTLVQSLDEAAATNDQAANQPS
jgi:acyl-coenzyme A synthetase/AMP-(fatty) acid ligase